MKKLLTKTNKMVTKAGGVLSEEDQQERLRKYRLIIKEGRPECPIIVPYKGSGRKRWRRPKREIYWIGWTDLKTLYCYS